MTFVLCFGLSNLKYYVMKFQDHFNINPSQKGRWISIPLQMVDDASSFLNQSPIGTPTHRSYQHHKMVLDKGNLLHSRCPDHCCSCFQIYLSNMDQMRHYASLSSPSHSLFDRHWGDWHQPSCNMNGCNVEKKSFQREIPSTKYILYHIKAKRKEERPPSWKFG